MSQHDDDVRARVLEWYAKAEEDFDAAETLLARDPPVVGPVGFHSQQCAEKYLKAFLTRHQVEFPKTHELDKLLALTAPTDACLVDSLRDADKLNPYGVNIRYPSGFPDMSPALAKQAFELASKVRDAVRGALRDFVGEKPD